MEKCLWLSGAQLRQAASDPRYPSAYQLLPPQAEPFAWDQVPQSELRTLDIYHAEVAGRLGLVQENLDAARRFHATLDLRRRPDRVRYFCFSGTRQKTATLVRLYHSGGRQEMWKQEVEGSGDGTVPVWSSGLPGVQNLPVGGVHGTLYKNKELRQTLAALLGAPAAQAQWFAPEAGEVEVALREQVVEPATAVHLALTFVGGSGKLDGELRMEAAETKADAEAVVFRPVEGPHLIRYIGPAAESLGLLLIAPDRAGVYRVAYYPQGEQQPAGSDELFVQEPAGEVAAI
jgi:hypothetical protein